MSMRALTLLASLTLAGLTCAQAQTTSGSAQPSTQQDAGPAAASSPHQRDTIRDRSQQEAPPEGDAATGSSDVAGRAAGLKGASSPHQRHVTHMAAAGGDISAGTPVQTRSGESLGTVVNVLPAQGSASSADASNGKGYVVVAGPGGSARPIPYAVASSMLSDGKLVVDRARLEAAPTVPQTQLEDRSGSSWHQKADRYWHAQQGKRSMSPGQDESSQGNPR